MKEGTSMEIPLNRKEFERRCYLLQESIYQGKMSLGDYVSLDKLRTLSNSRIDLLTIDESLRLVFNMNASMSEIIKHIKEDKV